MKKTRRTIVTTVIAIIALTGFQTEVNSRDEAARDSVESRIRVLCTLTYFCYISGNECPDSENWPILANFGELGTHEVTCYEGAVIED